MGATAIGVLAACAKLVADICFHFFNHKNCNEGEVVPAARAFLFNILLAIFVFLIANAKAAAASMSNWLHLSIFAFPLVKIVKQEQLCQQQPLFYQIHF